MITGSEIQLNLVQKPFFAAKTKSSVQSSSLFSLWSVSFSSTRELKWPHVDLEDLLKNRYCMFGQLMQKDMQVTTDASIVFLGKIGIHTKHTNKLHTQLVCLDPTTTRKRTTPQQQATILCEQKIQKTPCLRMCCIEGERYQIQSIIGRGIQQNIRRLKGSKFLTNSQVTATQQSEGPRWGELGLRFLMAKK